MSESVRKALFFLSMLLFFTGSCTGQPGRALIKADPRYFLPLAARKDIPAFSFISWGDTKDGTAVLAALSNQAMSFRPLFTIYPGDLELNGFTPAGMSQWMAAMDGGKANGLAGIAFPVRGNHDADDPAGWQAYFHLSDQATGLKLANFTNLDENLTYSFDAANAHFIGVDIPGDIEIITQRQVEFIDQDLSAAESRGLLHAFLFFHGPIYPVSSHTDCPERACAVSPEVTALIAVLNKHPIVSATFHGHEHLLAYAHLDKTRIPGITHPFEEFITGSAGASVYPCNKSYRFETCDPGPGFAAVRVDGQRFTVGLYRLGQWVPLKEYSFVKVNFAP
jgi:hypothetical protein